MASSSRWIYTRLSTFPTHDAHRNKSSNMENSIELKKTDRHYATPIEQVGCGSDDALSDILSTESHDKADMERLGKRQELRVCKV